MKVTKILAGVVLTLSMVSCNKQGVTNKSLNTEMDSVSYAIGLDMATKLKTNFSDLDSDLLIQGYRNGIDSTNLLIESKDLNNVISTFFRKQQQEKFKKQQEEAAVKAEKEFGDYKIENEKFIAENKSKEGVVTTASGLQYVILKEGTGDAPKPTSKVKVHYHGTNIAGEVFDSSVDRKQAAEFGVNQVIKGWTEGLQLMKPGSKYKFFIPQDLAYGAQQRGEKIKPFSALVFEVELLEVK